MRLEQKMAVYERSQSMKSSHSFYLVAWSFVFVSLPCVYGEPDINVVPLSHDFGQVEVGSSESVVITINNDGYSGITIESATFQSGSDYSITSLFFPPVVFSAGGHFDLEITFAPSVSGSSQDILEIVSSDPDEPLVEVVLTGEGTGGETSPTEQIEEINDFAQMSADGGTLVGKGSGSSARNRLRTFVKKLQKVESLIEQELFSEACGLLKSVYKHADGLDHPKDFVEGEARAELAAKIEELIAALDCD
jgi:hypothetical protein